MVKTWNTEFLINKIVFNMNIKSCNITRNFPWHIYHISTIQSYEYSRTTLIVTYVVWAHCIVYHLSCVAIVFSSHDNLNFRNFLTDILLHPMILPKLQWTSYKELDRVPCKPIAQIVPENTSFSKFSSYSINLHSIKPLAHTLRVFSKFLLCFFTRGFLKLFSK